MLRDVISSLDNVATWPCDEINYIWRHGNRNFPTDEMTRTHANACVIEYIRDQFNSCIAKSGLDHASQNTPIILEKTCANSLRVPFVDKVLPEARYIHLVRDGRDVVSSALVRWKAPLDIPYLYAKARYVPKSDLAFYATRYLANRYSKLRSNQSTLSAWGPKFEGIDAMVKDQPISDVCAAQWVRCVELASDAFSEMDEGKVLTLRYEDFVSDPVQKLSMITQFLSLDCEIEELERACAIVRSGSVGKGKNGTYNDMENSERLMQSTLRTFGYVS